MIARQQLARAAAVALLAATAAQEAWARAGGANHTGSSHASTNSGSFSHSADSSGGSFSLGGLITLLVIGLVVWAIYRRITRRPDGTRNADATNAVREALGAAIGAAVAGQMANRDMPGRPVVPPAVDAIRVSDPGFELETFMQRAEMAFFLVKRGMQKNDAAAVRPFVSDALFAQLAPMLGRLKEQHQQTLLESLNVRSLHLVDASCDEQGQSIQIHYDLVYRAKTIDNNNRVLQDEGEDGRHGEHWIFVRNAQARTPVDGGVTASRCPACGAELRLSLDGTCTHCRASVTNGSVDWVVSEVRPAPFMGITSDSQFAQAAPTVGEGVASLQATDPAFSMEAFQVRVSTAFVALQDAWCQQKLEAGRVYLSPGAYFAWSAQIETLVAEGRRNVIEQLSIAAVEPVRIVHGRVFDDLTVRIRAASADYDIDQSGRIVFGDRTVRDFSEEWTFQRSVGVMTSGKPGTLENTCPSCGAPVVLTQIGECKYCKAAVTSGRFDWVVSRIEQEDEEQGGGGGDFPGQLAAAVGGAIVGGLLGNLLSDD